MNALSLVPAQTDPAPSDAITPADATGEVVVRYNHYNKSFPIVAGVLKWEDVDEEYALSFVFKGNFQRIVAEASTGQPMVQDGDLYRGLSLGTEYRIEIIEDPAQLAEPTKPYVPLSGSATCSGRVFESCNEFGIGGREEGCSCLYGNPCAVPYNCKDWKNRNEVARRNGWKGFS